MGLRCLLATLSIHSDDLSAFSLLYPCIKTIVDSGLLEFCLVLIHKITIFIHNSISFSMLRDFFFFKLKIQYVNETNATLHTTHSSK